MSDFDELNDLDEDVEEAKFLEIFEAFTATATALGWNSAIFDEVLRISMTNELGSFTMQVRLSDDKMYINVSVVYEIKTIAVTELQLFKIINNCNDIQSVGTFYYFEKQSQLVWHTALILGDLPGFTLAQTRYVYVYALEGMQRINNELFNIVKSQKVRWGTFTEDTPVMGSA